MFFLAPQKNCIFQNNCLLKLKNTNNPSQLKQLTVLMKEESEKVGLKLNIQKIKIMASSPITSWQTHGETMERMTDFIFGTSQIIADGDCKH